MRLSLVQSLVAPPGASGGPFGTGISSCGVLAPCFRELLLQHLDLVGSSDFDTLPVHRHPCLMQIT